MNDLEQLEFGILKLEDQEDGSVVYYAQTIKDGHPVVGQGDTPHEAVREMILLLNPDSARVEFSPQAAFTQLDI